MKDRPEPERIEIELTSNVDREIDGVGGEVAVMGPTDDADRPVVPDQRRVFAVAAVVGVLAMLLGWLIGRSTGSDEVATTSVTIPETTEAVAETLMPGDTLPSASTTTSRPRRSTTTTTLAPPTIEAIAIDQRLEGVDLRLVGLEHRSELVELDLADRTLTRQDVRRSFEPEAMLVGEDWILFRSFGGGTSFLLRDGGAPQRVDLGEAWELLWQEGTDRFWRPDYELEWFTGPSLYEEVDLTGEPTGVTLELPVGAWVHQTDPKGGLIVEATGKNYSISESGISLIGAGEMIGLSANVAVSRDCDEQLRCGLFVTDRLTGAVRGLELDPPLDELLPIESMYGWGLPGHAGAISPDGTMLAVMLQSHEAPLLGLIDLSSGALVDLGETWWLPTVVWSPDSRFAFFLEGAPGFGGSGEGNLSAYDRQSGEVFPVSSRQLDWESLAARPMGS